jgi:hypothetical protein
MDEVSIDGFGLRRHGPVLQAFPTHLFADDLGQSQGTAAGVVAVGKCKIKLDPTLAAFA